MCITLAAVCVVLFVILIPVVTVDETSVYVTPVTKRKTWLTYRDTYTCELEIGSIVDKFLVNISIDTYAQISNTVSLSVLNKSADGLWFFGRQVFLSFPPTINIWFDLTKFATEPAGNCTWFINDGNTYTYDPNDPYDGCVNVTVSTNDTLNSCWNNTHHNLTDPVTEENSTHQHTTTPAGYTVDPTTDGGEITTTSSTETSQTTEPGNCDNTTDCTTAGGENVTTAYDSTTGTTSSYDVTDANLNDTYVDDENSTCLCECACEPVSRASANYQLMEILRQLKIPRNSTALAKRKKECASDKRWLSRGIGGVGVLVLTVVFGVILIGDTKLLLRDARRMLGQIRRHICFNC